MTSSRFTGPIGPGATIGVLGGGQLGRMLAVDARRMGYGVAVLDPSAAAPAAPVADHVLVAPFGDPEAARALAERSAIVTFEVEHVPLEAAAAAAALRPIAPSLDVLAVCQHRVREREFLEDHGFPVAPWRAAADAAAVRGAVEALGSPCVVKVPFAGYDGRGQVRVPSAADVQAVDVLGWERGPLLVERHIPFATELSVIVARRRGGEAATYPVVRTVHEDGILVEASAPAMLDAGLEARARGLAESIAAALGLVGVMAVEMFLLDRGELLINELAPRPHNSGHHTIEACVTSQFAQHVRAICDLPLGDTALRAPVCVRNLLGEGRGPYTVGGVAEALADATVTVHLYGKAEVWPRRKMGHVTAFGRTPDDARERARRAAAAIRWVQAP